MSLLANMMNEYLCIKEINKKNDDHYRFECIGYIDVHAESVLKPLYAIPAGAQVMLNFAQVDRVNSMGLSLLLKCFEALEINGTRVEVYNLNRMIKMLFKITGLGRFLKIDSTNDATASKPATARPRIPQPKLVPCTPAQEQKPRRSNNSTVSIAKPVDPKTIGSFARRADVVRSVSRYGKLNFVASLQTGGQLGGWYMLNTYLQNNLKKAIHFEQCPAGQEITGVTADMLFAKPFEACEMMSKYAFLPVMRPRGDADEIVILTRADENRELGEIPDAKVAVASTSSFVYLLGRLICDENGIDSNRFQYIPSGNEIKALQMLLKRRVDLLFMLQKTYWGLSSFSRNAIRLLDQSETNFAFHLFCVSPKQDTLTKPLGDLLSQMSENTKGQQILKDVRIDGWHRPEDGEIDMLMRLFERYVVA